jgi:hypothetical protein
MTLANPRSRTLGATTIGTTIPNDNYTITWSNVGDSGIRNSHETTKVLDTTTVFLEKT